MAPAFFQKPEAALKRSEELIAVGKQDDALDCLHETIKARRHKQWTQTHEDIMMMHLTLCVELRKPHLAKDALFQYKSLTQSVVITSLEKVITNFLNLAEQRTEEAQKTSIEKVEEIDDLDLVDAPENLLLSVVSNAAVQDRMDRTVLAPWLRFLWDSYRNCLELLRNNAQVEQLYHKITRQSLNFCAKYQRRTEFRKLSELLRLHLNQAQKLQNVPHVVKFTSNETLMLNQDTRLCQLDTAIKMELWQEAYRSAEDVHGMMQLSKDKDRRVVKPASYVNYYDKLSLVFWKAGNHLFHAAALLQKFIIYKDMKKSFSTEEAQDQATRVLLATLSIPDQGDTPADMTRLLDMEDSHITNIRLLSNLLKLPIAPTRAGVLREASRLLIPEMAHEEAAKLFKLLENNFAPNKITLQTDEQLKKIAALKTEYAQYTEPLQMVAAVKALKQISVIYENITWPRLQKMLHFFDDMQMERFLTETSKHRLVRATIDHRLNCIRFDDATEATLAGCSELEEADGFTGDDVQLGVGGIRTHLERMHNKLKGMVNWLDGDASSKMNLERVISNTQVYHYHKKEDYERILQRRKKIELYKETRERNKEERSAQAIAEKARVDEQRRNDERARLEAANREQEIKRKQNEQEEIQRRIRADQMKKLQQSSLYQAVLSRYTEEELANLDPEAVLREQRARLDQERQEQQQRLQQQEKKFDHMIRAFHLEEVKERRYLEDYRQQKAMKFFAEYEKRRVAKEIQDYHNSVELYAKLQLVKEQIYEYNRAVKTRNVEKFAEKEKEFEDKLAAVREARLAERAEERRQARREDWLAKQAELERQKKEEEERLRQKQFEEQQKAGRGERFQPRRDRDNGPSIAMSDNDWRGGPRAPIVRPDRPPVRDVFPRGESQRSEFSREDRGSEDRERDSGAFRRKETPAATQGDLDNNWRSGARAQVAPPDPAPSRFADRDRANPPFRRDREDREDGGSFRRPPVSAVAPSDKTWERGTMLRRAEPPATASANGMPQDPRFANANAGAAAPAPSSGPKPGAYITPQLRRQMQAQAQGAGPGPAAPAAQPAQTQSVDQDGFTQVSGPRRPVRPMNTTRPAPSRDIERNWR